ncbi:MAG: hypothetical protein ACLPN1_04430 [Dissulfurispiraceae bacterium]
MMNNLTAYSIRKSFIVLLLIFLSGCSYQVPVEDLSNEWISRPLDELKQAMKSPDSYASKIGWQEKTYPLAEGHFAYVEPISPDCSIQWSINERDIIVDYRAMGKGCKHTNAPSTSEGNMSNITKPTTLW